MTMPPITSASPVPPRRPEAPRPMFSALAIASSGLSAQRVRMEVVAQNLANAATSAATTNSNDSAQTDSADVTGGVRVASITEDKSEGALIYDPGHPDADK